MSRYLEPVTKTIIFKKAEMEDNGFVVYTTTHNNEVTTKFNTQPIGQEVEVRLTWDTKFSKWRML